MLSELRFVVVEDKDDDRREVLNLLSDVGLQPSHNLGTPETYEDAKASLEQHAAELNVVFLDLNIPRDVRDGRPEKGHGKALLDIIHNDLNQRASVDIQVIVVSGEDILDGMQDKLLYEHYKGTLVGIAQKAELPTMLTASLRRLTKDPLRSGIRRCGIAVLGEYETLIDSTKATSERLRAARSLAIRLVQYEVDHHNGRIDSALAYSDDLHGLIRDHLEPRFSPDERGKRRVREARIISAGGWPAFLWRGWMVSHLYTLNTLRNELIHIPEQPLRARSAADTWLIPADVLRRAESGQTIGKIAELIVRDLLEWYLPWHEQVYLPWARAGGKP